MSNKAVSFIARWIFILCLPFLLLTATIGYTANSLWIYKYSFSEYNVVEKTGISGEELERAARELISYFNSGNEYADIVLEKDGVYFNLFSREESIHMKDVKGLFRLDYIVLLCTLVYVLGYGAFYTFWHGGRYQLRLAGGVIWGSGITLAVLLALWIGMQLDFDRLFLQFHLLSFTNEFWSAEGYMTELFPYGFWYDVVIFCVVVMVIAAAALGSLAAGYNLIVKKTLHSRKQIS